MLPLNIKLVWLLSKSTDTFSSEPTVVMSIPGPSIIGEPPPPPVDDIVIVSPDEVDTVVNIMFAPA